MTRSPRRAIARPFLLAAALFGAGARLLAADGIPCPAPAESLEAVEKPFEALGANADKEARRREFDAVFAYLQSHPRAKDLEATRWRLVQLAMECREWDLASQRTVEYLAVHSGGPHEIEALLARAQVLGKLDRLPEAKTVFDRLTARLSPAGAGKDTLTAVWLHYADTCLDADDVEGAKVAFRGLKAAFQNRSDGAEPVRLADSEIAKLDQIGKDAKGFPADAVDLDGKPVTLADYAGKMLMIDFWATWCVPCRKEMPNVLAQYGKFHEKGFEVMGVTIDARDQGATVRNYVKASGMPWRQIHYATAARNAMADLYGVHSVPYTILIGRDGKILRVGLRGEGLVRFLERTIR